MTDYNKFDIVKNAILQFRTDKEKHKGQYKRFVNEAWENAILEIHRERIAEGRTRTR